MQGEGRPIMLLTSPASVAAARPAATVKMRDPLRDPWRDPTPHSPPEPWHAGANEDLLDAGMDSFPASDPPSWGPLRVGAPATR